MGRKLAPKPEADTIEIIRTGEDKTPMVTMALPSRRYYPEEMEGFDNAVKALIILNDELMAVYNAEYAARYLKGSEADVYKGGSYSPYIKETFKECDYYTAALHTNACNILSTQKASKKTRIASMEYAAEKARGEAAEKSEQLTNKKLVKQSLVVYAKTGEFPCPYEGCTLKIQDGIVSGFLVKDVPFAEYERSVEEDIRQLKHVISEKDAKADRIKKKLDEVAIAPPARIIFGSRKLYKQKDKPMTKKQKAQWEREFFEKRHSSFSIAGRHTMADGNCLVHYNKETQVLTWNLPHGLGDAVFPGFQVMRHEELFLGRFGLNAKERTSIAYNIKLHRDGDGRRYFTVSPVISIPDPGEASPKTGVVSADLNVDYIAYAIIEADGTLKHTGVIPLNLYGPKGQNRKAIGQAVKKLMDICKVEGKPLVIESLDFCERIRALTKGNPSYNRMISSFCYGRFRENVKLSSFVSGTGYLTVDPAYTSFLGKILFMGKYGISIHCAAAYCIGLKAMGLLDKIPLPEPYHSVLVTKNNPGPFTAAQKAPSLCAWAKKNHIRAHAFYMKLGSGFKTKKALLAEMKKRDIAVKGYCPVNISALLDADDDNGLVYV